MATATLTKSGDIAVIRLAHPPVNALAQGVRQGIQDGVAAANADPSIKAIVVTGEGRAFSAGADITEFRSGPKPPGLGEVIDTMEASAKPVVAALNGLALGGGLEVALGCHYRVASKAANQLGLPEVKIGILPGAGGTQRLPRIIGVEAALDMIVSGNPINAEKAAKVGLVDRLVEATSSTARSPSRASWSPPAKARGRAVRRASIRRACRPISSPRSALRSRVILPGPWRQKTALPQSRRP